MPGRKMPIDPSETEAYHEYRQRERVERGERGEKIVGEDAKWLDARGDAARIARRRDADRRHGKNRS